MSPNSRASRIRSATSRRLTVSSSSIVLLELLVARTGENDVLLHRGSLPGSLRTKRTVSPPNRRFPARFMSRLTPWDAGLYPHANARSNADAVIGGSDARLSPGYPVDPMSRTHRSVADRRRRDPLADRAGADGRRVGAGVPAPGPALRRRPRVQRDGVVVRALVRQRAHARLPADRPRRASPGRADLRLRAGADGRGRRDGRRRRRGHRRHQLRLPGAQGDQDRRRRQRARGSRAGLRGSPAPWSRRSTCRSPSRCAAG